MNKKKLYALASNISFLLMIVGLIVVELDGAPMWASALSGVVLFGVVAIIMKLNELGRWGD